MAGLPSNPISVNQSKQYGDVKALDKLKTGLTSTPMTGVPTPAPTAGRPPTGGGSPQASASGGQQGLPPEHQQMMSEFAVATKVKQYWDSVAAQYPSSWARMYAADADENYQRLAHEMRAATPFFSGT